MYLCDPSRGRARRSRLAGELSGYIRRDEKRTAKRTKDVLHRLGGLAAEAVSSLTEEADVADEILTERINSKLGHVLSHPHQVEVHAKNGVVTLEGKLTHAERRRLKQEVKAISGVKRVNDCLTARPSAFAPGVLVGLAAGLALLGMTGPSRPEAAGPKAS